jgi:tetratricopeptide (TPR) repeat protein
MKKSGTNQSRKKQSLRPAKSAKQSAPRPLKSGGKAVAKPKSRSTKTTSAKTATRRVEAPPPPVIRRKPTAEEIAYQNALAQFENALKLLNENHFAKARPIFERLVGTATPDLAQRARIFLNVCNQRLSRPAVQLKTADDHYNYGVQLANRGMLDEAEEALKKALKLAPQCDYIHYALASTSALRENPEQAMEHLGHAIELNSRNRYLAQNDPDFSSLSEDPRFTELLYPEKPV